MDDLCEHGNNIHSCFKCFAEELDEEEASDGT